MGHTRMGAAVLFARTPLRTPTVHLSKWTGILASALEVSNTNPLAEVHPVLLCIRATPDAEADGVEAHVWKCVPSPVLPLPHMVNTICSSAAWIGLARTACCKPNPPYFLLKQPLLKRPFMLRNTVGTQLRNTNWANPMHGAVCPWIPSHLRL